jgi:hypothetical protein
VEEEEEGEGGEQDHEEEPMSVGAEEDDDVDSLITTVSSAERSFHPSNPFGINRGAATGRTATVVNKAKAESAGETTVTPL